MRNPFRKLARLSLGSLGGAVVGGLAGIGLAVLGFVTCAAATGYDAGQDVVGYGLMAATACVFVGVIAGGFTGVLLAARRQRAAEAKPAPPTPQPPPLGPPAQ
jgi:hypothetical protein